MNVKKLVGTVLSVVLAAGILTVFPWEFSRGIDAAMTVSAEKRGFIVKTDSDGDMYISGYNGDGGDITIPDGVVWIGEKAFYGNRNITSVTVPASCWYWVDTQAFAFCPNLKTVTFNGSIGGIGEGAFYGCTALEKVTFGGSVGMESGKGGIGNYAFSYCTSLKTVDFTNSKANADMLGACAFSDCIKLNSVNLPSGLKYIYDDAFVNCAALTSIEVPTYTKISGSHVFGYMYGKSGSYVKADGSTKANIFYWKEEGGNFSEASGNITQKAISITAAEGSEAAKYAAANGIPCNYTDEVYVPEKLPAPKNIKASKDSGKIVLTWDSVGEADGYRVYMYNDDSGKYEEYKSIRTEQCTVTDIESGREYKFIVAALDLVNGSYVRGKTSKAVTVEV